MLTCNRFCINQIFNDRDHVHHYYMYRLCMQENYFNYNLWQHSLCIENLTTEEFSFAYSAVLAITPVPVITIPGLSLSCDNKGGQEQLISKRKSYPINGICKTLLLLLLLYTKNLTSGQTENWTLLHFCLTKTFFMFQSIAMHNLIQSQIFTNAHSNYLICMCFIWINMSMYSVCNKL